ncbi:hypothetical protein G5B46_09905 [Caulobacter sp. 602-2]|uniref:Uncharacterized protein n=1 Tax=Caulobacter sp. 602-2 TaxID=2710887 RepID=A0A6G4QYB2_9CAUL|nr:hypothetical protein [Caulobacter sp. 602-2]NGM49918.1 hypothetical protein [Caulobacter sp. 602-2]
MGRRSYMLVQGGAAVVTGLQTAAGVASCIAPYFDEFEEDPSEMTSALGPVLVILGALTLGYVLNAFSRRDKNRPLRIAANLASGLGLLLALWFLLMLFRFTYEPGLLAPLVILGTLTAHGVLGRPVSREGERRMARRPPLSLADPQNP